MPTQPTNVDTLEDSLPSFHQWAGRPTLESLKALPGCPAVVLFVDSAGRTVQLATTQQLKRFAISRLIDPDESRRGRADLAEIVRGVRWRQFFCPFEGRWWYYRMARKIHPGEYRKLTPFGPAWFVHVDWEMPIPELRVSEKIWRQAGQFVGPWPTHKSALEARDALLDMFDLCRYPEQIRKAPEGVACPYADMGRCDAPCDGSVPINSYLERMREAWQFAEGRADDWVDAATARMREAAGRQEFETAAVIKQQLALAETWRKRWHGRVVSADRLEYLLALPVTRRKAWKLVLFRKGHIDDGPVLPDRKLAAQAPRWLAERLNDSLPELDATVRMEQTWLLAHFLQHKESQTAIVAPIHDGIDKRVFERTAE